MDEEVQSELREAFADSEYRHAYANSFLNTSIAAQIKALRERQELSQEELGQMAGMRQNRISLLENVNYSSWTINSLRRLAEALDLALVVKFESFGKLLEDIASLSVENLVRPRFDEDPAFGTSPPAETPDMNKVVDLAAYRLNLARTAPGEDRSSISQTVARVQEAGRFRSLPKVGSASDG